MNVVGIDLGTSMSVIARLDPTGAPVTVANNQGDPTPSVIDDDSKSQKAVVGKTAKGRALNEPDKVAGFVKREIGCRTSYSRPVDGRVFRPETLSAIILRKLSRMRSCGLARFPRR